jgi:hypothetical protein
MKKIFAAFCMLLVLLQLQGQVVELEKRMQFPEKPTSEMLRMYRTIKIPGNPLLLTNDNKLMLFGSKAAKKGKVLWLARLRLD